MFYFIYIYHSQFNLLQHFCFRKIYNLLIIAIILITVIVVQLKLVIVKYKYEYIPYNDS